MPSDEFLVASLRGGDEAALRVLMDRYDRLVRFTIFRLSKTECRKDQHWLETLAADTWMGFLRSVRKDPGDGPRSVPAYLATIARFKVTSALRSVGRSVVPAEMDDDLTVSIEASLEDPVELLAGLEELDVLRDRVRGLDAEDQMLWGQLRAILDRRWVEAARALGMSESTLRSRWKRVLERLKEAIEGPDGRSIAPRRVGGDS